MKIADLVYDLIVENFKRNEFFYKVVKKWSEESPRFGALDSEKQMEIAEKIFKFHNNIKNSISPNVPAVASFLARYDGEFGSKKYELNDLKDIQRLPLSTLAEFLSEWGKFHIDVDLSDDSINSEENENELQKIFDYDGPNVSPEKWDVSKKMWYDEDSAMVNKPGFRVYEVMNEEMSKRFGYYYQLIHKENYIRLRGENGDRSADIRAPWCVTWRGNTFKEYAAYDENNKGIGKPILQHGGNLYGTYRKEGKTFYFVIDETKDKTDQYYMSALQKKNREWIITSMFNNGDLTKTWEQIIAIYPQLEDEKDKFRDRPLDPKEMDQKNITNQIDERGGANDFVRQNRARRDAYVTMGGYITLPRSWSVMDTDLRDKYINTMDIHNAFQKIRNESLLTTIINTPGFKDVLVRRLNVIGKDLSYLVDKIMENDYERVYTGKKNKNVIIYKSKSGDFRYGIFDLVNNTWLEHDGIKYNAIFEEGPGIVNIIPNPNDPDDPGTLLYIYYTNPNGQKFYTIHINLSVSEDDDVARVFILSEKQFNSIKSKIDDNPGDVNQQDADLGEEIEKGL